MRHTVGMRQSVILTRKVDYAAFCQGANMSFYSTMRLGVVRLGGARHCGMRHFTTPPAMSIFIIDASWIKVTITLLSPKLVWTSFNVALSLCYCLWNVACLSLSRTASFKMSLELMTGSVLVIMTCKWHQAEIKVSEDKPNRIFIIKEIILKRPSYHRAKE
jgi:hypothetical protein